MHEQPKKLEVRLDAFAAALPTALQIVFDFETTAVDPHVAEPVGLGVYIPHDGRVFYINVGHDLDDARIPRHDPRDLVEVLRPFFADTQRHGIAHNATFELRMLRRMNITDVRCRISCSLIHSHRADENLRTHGSEPTSHYHLPKGVTYGLKELTLAYFKQRPPKLHEVTAGKNPRSAPPRAVAEYCALDVLNSYNLYARAKEVFAKDRPVERLIADIDDPNNIVLAKMIWNGIQIDADEARRQRALYDTAIQRCREEIWQLLRINLGLDTPDEIRRLLAHPDVGCKGWPTDDWADESIAHEAKVRLFEECQTEVGKRVIALLIAKSRMIQRINTFLTPLPEHVRYTGGRFYARRFDSTLTTTRFSCNPNLQNLPGRADAVSEDDAWQVLLPKDCEEQHSTRNVLVAPPGKLLVSMDLSAAEPRYLALLFQRALEHKHGPYLVRKEQLNNERLERHGELIFKMRQTQKPVAAQRPSELEWPDIEEDPLWRVFARGEPFDDPYNALLAAMEPEQYAQVAKHGTVKDWFEQNRWRGKLGFLALAYGSQASSLAPKLRWTAEKTAAAIANLEAGYPVLKPLRELTTLEVIHLGEVRTLWGRPRRLNGYYQLARSEPLTVGFYRLRPSPRNYVARIIPLGATRQGVQALVEECYIESEDGKSGEVVLAATRDGTLTHACMGDPFVNRAVINQRDHFNSIPFRNINFNQMNWVREENGLTRRMAEQRRATRQAFNARAQGTGADHLRWLMNAIDSEVCTRPEFDTALLVLTMHDSLIFEVSEVSAKPFAHEALAVMRRRPPWADIEFATKVEIGQRFGEMEKLRD